MEIEVDVLELKPTFNSLSRDHGITYFASPPNKQKLKHFQLPLSGSQEFGTFRPTFSAAFQLPLSGSL